MKIHISKLDAAKRQLEMAVRLFMSNSEPVSIHTLVGAAHQVLEDICIQKGHTNIRQDVLNNVKEEYKEMFKKSLNKPRNFFKHADKDPEGIIEFTDKATMLEMWDACRMYRTLTGEMPPLLLIYTAWFHVNNPRILILTEEQKVLFESMIKDAKNPEDRQEFLRNFMPAAEAVYRGDTTY